MKPQNINQPITTMYHKIPVSTNLLLIKNNSVLLSLRGDVKQDKNLWCLVVGHLEEGESPSQSMIREAKEEINIDIAKEDLIPISTMYGKKPEYMGVFFKVTKWSGEVKNMEGDKCQELRFFDINNLPENIIPYIRQSIDDYKNNIVYSEIGC